MADRHIQTIVPSEKYRQLKLLALNRGVPLKDLLREIVYEYLTKQGVLQHGQENCRTDC
jgi:hypothetical protein